MSLATVGYHQEKTNIESMASEYTESEASLKFVLLVKATLSVQGVPPFMAFYTLVLTMTTMKVESPRLQAK